MVQRMSTINMTQNPRTLLKLNGQRPVGTPEENGATFSDHTEPTKRNGSYHLVFLFRIPYNEEK